MLHQIGRRPVNGSGILHGGYGATFILAGLTLVALFAACGQRHLARPGLSEPDTAATVLANTDRLGSVVLGDVINRKPSGSELGFRVQGLGDTHDETYRYDYTLQLGCDIRDAVNAALRQRELQPREPGSLCIDPARSSPDLGSQADIVLAVELLDFAYNEHRAGFLRLAKELDCNAEASLRWSVAAPSELRWFSKQTMSRFEGRCRAKVPADGLVGSVRVGLLQLLADSEFLEQVSRFDGHAAELQRLAVEAERERLAEEAVREREAALEAERAARERLAALRQRELEAALEAERAAAEREEAERATWGRAVPTAGMIIVVGPELQFPIRTGSVVDRARRSVVTLFTQEGSGSGFIISSDGLALTNRHVLDEGARPGDLLRARFADGIEVPARVMRVSPRLDIALVQVLCEERCRTLRVSPDLPALGSDVFLMGSPRGLDFSVSRGVISSLRFFNGSTVIQTDAAANPGNSGGPLVEASGGGAVGILTFGLVQSEGLSFAILLSDALGSLGLQIR